MAEEWQDGDFKMDATGSFEALLTLYQTAQRHIAEDINIHLMIYI
jgi:hypothetical protein